MECARNDAGQCGWKVEECPGIVCPDGKIEVNGRCVQPCLGDNMCPNGQRCNDGEDVCLRPPECGDGDRACLAVCYGFCVPNEECSVDGVAKSLLSPCAGLQSGNWR